MNRKILRYIIKGDISGIIGTILIVGFIFSAIFAPMIAPYDPYHINPPERLQPPSLKHFFGTDSAGRDIFSRVIYGTRISLKIGTVIVSIAVIIGSLFGAIAAFFGGYIDEIIMRTADIFMTFPSLILAIAINAALGPGLSNAMIALSAAWWPTYARLMRGQVLSIKEEVYIESVKALGASNLRIIFHHILPNSWSPIMVRGTLDFGNAIMECAGLSFIGLGAQPPLAEWGAMITRGRSFLDTAWWYPTFPGLAILITVLGFNLIGDSLQDILNPQLRKR